MAKTRFSCRAGIRPPVTRIDDPKIRQSAIHHRARRKANILAKLRLNQNDGRTTVYRGLCFICSSHGNTF
jgi:hypothetical protein